MGVDELDGTDDEGSLGSRHHSPQANEDQGEHRPVPSESDGTSRSTSDLSPSSIAGPSSQSSISVASLLRQPAQEAIRLHSQADLQLTQKEAQLVHYYSEYLGRWLDGTDASRQFTLGVPEKLRKCPVLCHSVLSFAARHRRDDVTADAAYQRCIALLIRRLSEPSASHDETLLCAIVILRFFEQLNGRFSIYVKQGSAYVHSTFHDRLRCGAAPRGFLSDFTCLAGKPLCRPFRTNTSRGGFLGLCPSLPLHGNC